MNQTTKQDTAQRAKAPAGLSQSELGAPSKARRAPAGYPTPKAQVTLRLSQPLIDRLKATGPGWISRLEQTIEQWARPTPKS